MTQARSPLSSGDQPDTLETLVARIARIGHCWSPSFSPDAARIAFVSDLNGNPQVWTVPTEGGWPDLVTALDDQVTSVSWSPDGAWLAFSLAPGGGMNSQVYLVHPDGTELHRITDGGKDNNWPGPWTYDGSKLLLASNRDNPDAIDSYLFDVGSGDLRRVVRNKGVGLLTDISRDHRRALLYREVNRSDSNLYLINLDSGDEMLLTEHEGPGNFGNGRFSPNGQTIYLSSDKDRELMAFARIRLDDGGRPGPIEVLAARDDAELQEFEFNDEGTLAALLWNVAGRNELVFFDLRTRTRTPGPDLPGEVVYGMSWSRDSRYLLFCITGSTSPLDVWVLERSSNRFRQVTHSPHAGVDLQSLIRPELVHFSAQDGLPLSGWLYRPAGFSAPGPIVLSFHGGPEGQERPMLIDFYQALLSQGIPVFAPNVRGSSGFGKTFVNLDNGPLRFDAIKDIKACVDYVVQAGIANPRQVGIMGGSYGGYMTMAGLTDYPELFAAGANLFGVVNFETFFAHTEPWMAAISKIEYGDPETQRDLLRRLSPINKIDRVVAPTIVLHGANDTNVPVVEAEQVVDNLKRRGIPVEYILFPDEGHGFLKTANRIRSTVSIVRWFAKYLTNE